MAKRPPKGAEEQQTNVPDSVYRQAYRELLVTTIAIDVATERRKSAVGVHRATVKAMQKFGVDTDAVLEAVRSRLIDPDELVVRERNRLRAFGVNGVLSLDQMNEIKGVEVTEPSAADWEAVNETTAGYNGYMAGRSNVPKDDNPYGPGTQNHAAWARGWNNAQADLAEELARTGQSPADTSRSKPT